MKQVLKVFLWIDYKHNTHTDTDTGTDTGTDTHTIIIFAY